MWGPVLLLIGVGIFTSPSYYGALYRDFTREPFASFVFGIFATAFGIAQVGLHNEWGSAQEVVVTLLAWGMLAKGAVFIVAPDIAAYGGTLVAGRRIVATIGAAIVVVGGYLSWVSYLA
jgi:hypothetical protein